METSSQDDVSTRIAGAPGGAVTACTVATGWGTAVRLAIVVSTVAALVVAAFAGRVADSTLICAVIAGSSIVGWFGAERAPAPAPIRLRRREPHPRFERHEHDPQPIAAVWDDARMESSPRSIVHPAPSRGGGIR